MTPRSFTVTETRQAMLVTADNLDEVAAWCGGEVRRDVTPPLVEYRSPHVLRPGPHTAHVGDVLVTDGPRWWDMPAAEFEEASAQWEEEGAQEFDVMAVCPHKHPELGVGCTETWGHDGDHRTAWQWILDRPAMSGRLEELAGRRARSDADLTDEYRYVSHMLKQVATLLGLDPAADAHDIVNAVAMLKIAETRR